MQFFRSAGAAVLVAFFAGLAPFPAEARAPADTLVIGAVAEARTLDPQAAVALSDLRIIANLFEGLVRFKPGTLEIEPALARSWTISPDGLTYRFALPPGLRFQDGTPADAQAVTYTFQRLLDPSHPEHNTGPFPLAFTFAMVKSVRAIDPVTVEFELRRPYAPLLSALASPVGSIVSPAAVRRYGSEFGRHPVGTGPFAFDSWTGNTAIELKANPSYRGGAPALAHLSFRPLAEAKARRSALQSGDIDVMMDAPFGDLPGLRAQPGFSVATSLAPHLWFLILNTRQGPFTDKRVRQAVNYAINKQRIVKDILQGGADVAGDPVPAAFGWADDPALAPYPFDRAKAKDLLRQAGAEGASLSFLVAQNGTGMLDPVAMGEAIEDDLEAVGLRVKIQTYEWTTFLANVNPGLSNRADMAEMAWTTSDPDTLPYLALRSGSSPEEGGFNAGYYRNDAVDRLLEEARSEADPAKRGALYRKVQAIVHEDAPWAFVASAKGNAVAAPGIGGLAIEPSFVTLFGGVTKR